MNKVMNALNTPVLTVMAIGLLAWLCLYHARPYPHKEAHKVPSSMNDIIMQGQLDLERHHRMEKKAAIVELFADDGMPVNQQIKSDEQRRMLKVRGRL